MTMKTRITARDYFQLPETNTPTELIDGELIVHPPPVPLHQRLVRRLMFLVDKLMSGGEIFCAPIAVYLDEDNVPEPDIVWLAPNSRCKVEEKQLVGAPELVIEVLSPSTAKYDKQGKFHAYEKHRVLEYWLVDPTHQLVEVWRHDEKRFVRFGVFGGDDTFISSVLGDKAVDLHGLFD